MRFIEIHFIVSKLLEWKFSFLLWRMRFFRLTHASHNLNDINYIFIKWSSNQVVDTIDKHVTTKLDASEKATV